MSYLQYPCHFCRKREVKVSHLNFMACSSCSKSEKDHSKCEPKNCVVARGLVEQLK